MARTLFTNVKVFDGSGSKPFAGEVLVQGNRIEKLAKRRNLAREGATVVDGGGATLMPGLCEGHGHLSFSNFTSAKELGEIPPEEHTLLVAHNARIMLDMGFTSVYSAASAKPRLEVAVRDAIAAGHIPGPRLKAASPEIGATGCVADDRQLHLYHESAGLIADGADEVRKAVRTMVRELVDTIKVIISGDNFTPTCRAEMLSYTEAEVAAAAEVADSRGVWLAAHARADAAIQIALRHNFRVIFHADFATTKTLDMLEAKKNEIFMVPAAGAIYTTAYEAAEWGVTPEIADKVMGLPRQLEHAERTYRAARKRGIRVLPGGDYGLAWNPIGTNARDLEHFVNLFGYTPAESLKAATKYGGQIMGMGEELGLVKPGYLADLIMVDGDPVEDITLLQDQDNILMVMKNGEYHVPPKPSRAAQRKKAA